MPAEIRITNARLKSLLVSLISFAIAAAASPLPHRRCCLLAA